MNNEHVTTSFETCNIGDYDKTYIVNVRLGLLMNR